MGGGKKKEEEKVTTLSHAGTLELLDGDDQIITTIYLGLIEDAKQIEKKQHTVAGRPVKAKVILSSIAPLRVGPNEVCTRLRRRRQQQQQQHIELMNNHNNKNSKYHPRKAHIHTHPSSPFPPPQMQLVEEICEVLRNTRVNPGKGSLPSVLVQHRAKESPLYEKVVGKYYQNSWHTFMKAHDDVYAHRYIFF